MPGYNKAAFRAQFKMPFEMQGYYVYVVSNWSHEICFEYKMVAAPKGKHRELLRSFRAGEPQYVYVFDYDDKKTFGPFKALGPPVRALKVYLRDLKYVQ